MNFSILSRSPLFADIDTAALPGLLERLKAKEAHFHKGGFIFTATESTPQIGIVLSGSAHVLQEDFWGNRTILSLISVGDLFGEAFACAEVPKIPVSVMAATTNTTVLLLEYQRIISPDSGALLFYEKLIHNLMKILAQKNIFLTQKIEHLSKNTIREKLLSFLSLSALQAHSKDVTIPFNRQELADYLSVNRSALSRELNAMKQDGLIDFTGNSFSLLSPPDSF